MPPLHFSAHPVSDQPMSLNERTHIAENTNESEYVREITSPSTACLDHARMHTERKIKPSLARDLPGGRGLGNTMEAADVPSDVTPRP